MNKRAQEILRDIAKKREDDFIKNLIENNRGDNNAKQKPTGRRG